MNIFILDKDVKENAQFMYDIHVGKMLLEAVQIMSTAIRKNSENEEHFLYQMLPAKKKDGQFYKATHKNHPCVLWAEQKKENFLYLIAYADALAEEFNYRFNKPHACGKCVFEIFIQAPIFNDYVYTKYKEPEFIWVVSKKNTIIVNDINPNDIIIKLYREYYASKDVKKNYTKRDIPDWLGPVLYHYQGTKKVLI